MGLLDPAQKLVVDALGSRDDHMVRPALGVGPYRNVNARRFLVICEHLKSLNTTAPAVPDEGSGGDANRQQVVDTEDAERQPHGSAGE